MGEGATHASIVSLFRFLALNRFPILINNVFRTNLGLYETSTE